ncbi:MAG: hypothetical protein IJH04_08625 [Eggerthellaceae bacterium]|nr:hypothetical protein [Eggerthellaceae bacterium]
MAEIHQNVALGRVDEDLMLFTDLTGVRGLLKNERESDEHPFIKFVNSRNLPEFLTAVDELYDMYGHTDFISDLMGWYRPKPVEPDRAEDIATLFEEKPTRTTIEKTREALEVWYFDSLKPSEDAQGNADLNDGRIMYLCTPLKDLIEAKEDLRRAANLMAWLVGKCTFEMAHGLTPGDKDAKLKTIDMEKETYLASYYDRLRKNSGNTFVDMNLHSTAYLLHLYREQDIESTVRSYVEAAFSLLLSDETRKMSYDLAPYTSVNTILSAAWSFFATGLDREEGPESIAVCKHCGKFFRQQRSTKQFCSDSCRVMYMRKHSGQPEPEMPETQTARWRRERRERERAQQAANAQ